MKAVIIIAACLALAVVLRFVDLLTGTKRINSVGAKSNNNSKNIATIDVNDPKSIEAGLEHYKDLVD